MPPARSPGADAKSPVYEKRDQCSYRNFCARASRLAMLETCHAKDAGAPYSVLEKTRHGHRNVSIALKAVRDFAGRKLVLVDDIISSGRTMIEAAGLLARAGSTAPI